jgi:hypothetical protein
MDWNHDLLQYIVEKGKIYDSIKDHTTIFVNSSDEEDKDNINKLVDEENKESISKMNK